MPKFHSAWGQCHGQKKNTIKKKFNSALTRKSQNWQKTIYSGDLVFEFQEGQMNIPVLNLKNPKREKGKAWIKSTNPTKNNNLDWLFFLAEASSIFSNK